jgi:signal transduction histidine kinase
MKPTESLQKINLRQIVVGELNRMGHPLEDSTSLRLSLLELEAIVAAASSEVHERTLDEWIRKTLHEFNNPLSGILGFTQLLLASDPLTGQQRKDLETIEVQIKRMRDLLERLARNARSPSRSVSSPQ